VATWSLGIIGLLALLFIGFFLAAAIAFVVPSMRKLGWLLLGLVLVVPLLSFVFLGFKLRAQQARSAFDSHRNVAWNSESPAIPTLQPTPQPPILPPGYTDATSAPLPPAYTAEAPPPGPNAATAVAPPPNNTAPEAPPAETASPAPPNDNIDHSVNASDSPPAETASPAPQKPAPEAPKTSPEAEQPIDKTLTAESSRLIDGLSKLLAKTILENPKTWQDLADKAAEQSKTATGKNALAAEMPAESKPAAATPLAQKPDWADQPFRKVGTDYLVDAVGEPFVTAREGEIALPDLVLKEAVVPFLERFMPEAIGKVRIPPELLRAFVVERWVETRNMQLGDMQIVHANVRIDAAAQEIIKNACRRSVVDVRLQAFGLYFTAGLLLLAAVWGYLKTDLATGGSRRGILRIAAGIVILSIVAATLLV
jgi:hypothetical protein